MPSQREFDTAVEKHVMECGESVRSHAESLSKEFGFTVATVYQLLVTKLKSIDNGLYLDGRAGWWRVRCRLFAKSDGYKEALADSDPDRAPDMHGETLLMSLPAVIKWVAELAANYHGNAAITGLDKESTTARLGGLRTQMSNRKDGTGLLNLHYTVPLNSKFRDGDMHMMARIDIVREAKSAATVTRERSSEAGAE